MLAFIKNDVCRFQTLQHNWVKIKTWLLLVGQKAENWQGFNEGGGIIPI